MSEQRSQEGPTPGFTPGWFAPRKGNPEPIAREAVQIPEAGDFFPITFLRSTETVGISRRPQRVFVIGRVDQPGDNRFDLAVSPGDWIVRDGDGNLQIWCDEDFKQQWSRTEAKWNPATSREPLAKIAKSLDRVLSRPEPGAWDARLSEADVAVGESPSRKVCRWMLVGVLRSCDVRIHGGHGGKLTESSSIDVANEIEAVLRDHERRQHLQPSPIHSLLDQAEIPKRQEVGEHRDLTLVERVELLVRRYRDRGVWLNWLNCLSGPSAAGTVPAGTKEIHIVLRSGSDEFDKFIELEDQDGKSLTGLERRIDDGDAPGISRIVIPYERTDR